MEARRAVAAAAALTLGACGFTLDGYSGGPGTSKPDGGSPEASPLEEGGTTSGADASSPDAGAPNIACADAFFCDDFERTSLLGGWDNLYQDTNSVASITTAEAFTGHSSLRIALAAAPESDSSLSKNLTIFSALDVSYAIYRETDISGADFMGVFWDSGGMFTKIFILIDSNTIVFAEQSLRNNNQTEFNQTGATPFPANTWVPVTMHVDFTAKQYSATVAGAVIADHMPMKGTYPNVAPTFQAGSDYSGESTAVTLDIDDVIIKLTP